MFDNGSESEMRNDVSTIDVFSVAALGSIRVRLVTWYGFPEISSTLLVFARASTTDKVAQRRIETRIFSMYELFCFAYPTRISCFVEDAFACAKKS